MTDSDSVNPFASPKQPTISAGPTISSGPTGDPIRYAATPTIDDLNLALRPVSSLILPVTLLSLLLFGYFVSIIIVGGHIVPLLIFVFLARLVGLDLFSKLYATELHLRLNPKATAPLTGELTSEGLLLQSENRISWQAHDGLLFWHAMNNQLTLCHDPRGEAVKILPTRGFHNPSQAIDFLEVQADKIPQLQDMRTPLMRPSMVGDQPAGAIAFGGILKAGDQEASPLLTIRKGNVKLRLTRLFVVSAVVLLMFALTHEWKSFLFVGGVIALYNLLVIRHLQSNSSSYDPELPLVATQGWLNSEEIALLHNVGQSRTGWQEFKSLGTNEACIWLECYGVKNGFVVLPRRFFANDAQWRAASEIASSHLDR